MSSEQEKNSDVVKGLVETLQRTEASLLPAVDAHWNSDQFQASQGLDFLDVKNSLLLTYLIELTHGLRQHLIGQEERTESALERLQLVKTVIDKSSGLDKKLRYQIDKLLAAGSTASTYAAGSENAQEDPLQFRPNLQGMDEEKDKGEDSSSVEGDHDDEDVSDDSNGGDDDDDELAAARMTVAKSRHGSGGADKRKKKHKNHDEDDDEEDEQTESGVYRAPRLTAVPYTQDKQDVGAERERRQRRKMRASELAQTLRAQYGEAPEQEDTHGGAELGRQREAARRMAEREKAKTRYEEDNMVRLVTSRKDKKDRKRLMRQEISNLAAIADMGNLVRESEFGEKKRKSTDQSEDVFESKRHVNGKRKKQMIDGDGKIVSGRKSVEAKNSLQEALFGGRGGGKKKGKKRKN